MVGSTQHVGQVRGSRSAGSGAHGSARRLHTLSRGPLTLICLCRRPCVFRAIESCGEFRLRTRNIVQCPPPSVPLRAIPSRLLQNTLPKSLILRGCCGPLVCASLPPSSVRGSRHACWSIKASGSSCCILHTASSRLRPPSACPIQTLPSARRRLASRG